MTTEDRNRAKIAKATSYIEANLSISLGVSEVAKHAGISQFHFQRLFCAYLGEPVKQYVTARRLEAAARTLMEQDDTSTLRIAIDCGFETHSAFSKAFKSRYGVSPSAFRKKPNSAQLALDANRQFLVTAPSRQMIEPVEVIDLPAFHFQFRRSFGTQDGQFFKLQDQDIARQLSALRHLPVPPDLFVMSCFPETPQSLNDPNVPVLFGGGYVTKTHNEWSEDWCDFGAGRWAVFKHLGDFRFLYQTWNRVYRNWLPQTNKMLRDEMPFEAYLTSSDTVGHTQPIAHIYIPIKKA